MKTRFKFEQRIPIFLTFTFLGVIFYLNFLRQSYGIDFTDESFYAATTYRFLLGDKPFQDDINVIQLGPLIGAVIIKAWSSITSAPAFESLVLHLRWIAFFFTSLVSIAVILFCSGSIQKRILVSTVPISFCIINILGLGYNVLAFSFLSISTLATGAVLSGKSKYLHILSGVSVGLACAFYPTLILGAPLQIILAILFSQKQLRVQTIVNIFIGYLVSIILIYNSAGLPELADIQKMLAYTKNGVSETGGLFLRLKELIWEAMTFRYVRIPFFGAIIVFVAAAIRKKSFLNSLIIFFDFYAIYLLADSIFSPKANERKFVFGLFVLLIVKRLLQDGFKQFDLRSPTSNVIMMSLVWGLIFGVSSGNGLFNFTLGAIGGLLWLLTLDFHWFKWARFKLFKMADTSLIMVLLISAVLTYQRYHLIYRDSPFKELVSRIDSGPFAGILTSKEKSDFILDLESQLKNYEGKYSNIFVYDYFPAGYLLSRFRPATDSTWIFLPYYSKVESRAWFIKRVQQVEYKSLVVFVKKHFEYNNDITDYSFYEKDPLHSYIQSTFKNILFENQNFKIQSI